MRLELANTLRNRTHQTSKGARLLNAFVDSRGGKSRVLKRPAIEQVFEAMDVGPGLGLFTWTTPTIGGTTTTLIGISNDVLNTSPTVGASAIRLAFGTQPADWKVQTAISPAVTVRATNAFGTTITSYTGSVSIALSANPSGGTLSGTLTATAVSGVATFSNLKLDRVGGGYKLRAVSGTLRPIESNVFKIISELSFTVQPVNSSPNTTMDPVEVSVVDSGSVTVAAYAGNISVRIGSNPASGVLSGTTTVATTTGVASFTNLEIDQVGNGYTLIASEDASNLVEETSSSFNITQSTHTLTAATDPGCGSPPFCQRGFDTGLMGSITPTTFSGATIVTLYTEQEVSDWITILVTGTLAQGAFTTLVANGKTLNSADANYFSSGGTSTWEWKVSTGDQADMFTADGTYPVTIS